MEGQQPHNSERFNEAIRRFDAENERDPNFVQIDGRAIPRELAYARWLTEWVCRLNPNSSEPLRLAARCQHLCRWILPRESYLMTRTGYLQWRQELKKLHASKTGEIMRAVGYPEEMVGQVQALNLKKNFPRDPDSQVLEDALCLVFLEHQFQELAEKMADDKMIGILQKTWKKISTAAQSIAATLPFNPREKDLLDRALAGPEPGAGEV